MEDKRRKCFEKRIYVSSVDVWYEIMITLEIEVLDVIIRFWGFRKEWFWLG